MPTKDSLVVLRVCGTQEDGDVAAPQGMHTLLVLRRKAALLEKRGSRYSCVSTDDLQLILHVAAPQSQEASRQKI